MPSLTSLRFFLALLVVCFHASDTELMSAGWLAWCLPTQAVSVFFVLSGFVLQTSYGEDMRGLGHRAFFTLRLARVWPLCALCVLVILVCLPVSLSEPGYALPSFLLVQAWSSDPAVNMWRPLIPGWSLSTEVFFYAVFPLFTRAIRRDTGFCLAVTAAFLLLYLLSMWALGAPTFWAGHISPAARLPEFILGMAAAEMSVRARRVHLSRGGWTIVEVAALTALLAVNAGLSAAGIGPKPPSSLVGMYLMGAGSAVPAAGLIVALGVGRGHLSSPLSWRPLVHLGEASFALYLIHFPLLCIPWTDLTHYLAACVGLSVILHRVIEAPVYAAVRRSLSRSTKQSALSA